MSWLTGYHRLNHRYKRYPRNYLAFLGVAGLEAVTLMHADHVCEGGGLGMRESEADRGRVPARGTIASPRLLRSGRPYPLDGDLHGVLLPSRRGNHLMRLS